MSTDWLHRPFGIMGHTCDFWLLPEDPAEQVRIKRGLGFQAEHWFAGRFKAGGDNGKSYYFRTRHGFLEDRLGPYLEAAHAQGLKVLVYLNVHWFSSEFPPAMLARKPDGSAMTAYGAGSLTCPAGPFYRFAMDLAEDIGEYAVDGVFLDGPYGSNCWCDHCRREHWEEFGMEMPGGRLSLAERRRLEQWGAEKIARFVGDFRRALRQKRPDAVVYHNGSSLGALTWSNQAAIREEDMLGIEGGFIGYGPLEGQTIYKSAATTKLLETLAGGKPTVIFIDHGVKVYDYYPLPRAEIDLMWAATLAGGANPWYVLYARNHTNHAADAARYWNGFINANADTLAGARAIERVALLWSDTTMLMASCAWQEKEDSVHAAEPGASATARPVKGDHRAAFWGAYAMLARSAIPFRVVTEKDVAGGLEGVDLLVVPSVAALEDPVFAAIERFVASGGTLVADDEFAVLGGEGGLRDAGRISALLGARAGEAVKAAQPNMDYIHVKDRKLGKGLTAAPLPRPTRAWRVTPLTGKPLAFFYEPLAGRYDDMPAVSDAPAVILTRVGQGAVIHMPMNLFEHYSAFNFDDHRRIVANLIGLHHVPQVRVEGLCGRGEVFVRGKEGRLLIHLVNYNGDVRPFARILPLLNVKVIVGKDLPVAAARALHVGTELSVRESGKGQTIRLGQLGTAETIVVELSPARTT